MNLLTLHPFWLMLLVVAVIACFSALVLAVGLFIAVSRKEQESPRHSTADTPSSTVKKVDIMGVSRPVERQSVPIEATQSQNEKPNEKTPTFAREIPSEELNHVFGEEEREDPDPEEEQVDWQEEETELQAHRAAADTDFATGAAFEDLQKATTGLQKEHPSEEERQAVIKVRDKLQHTDLWEKIINALPDTHLKIAKMLETSSIKQPASTTNDWQSFDIRNFIAP